MKCSGRHRHLDKTTDLSTICRDEWQDIRGCGRYGSLEPVLGHSVASRDLKSPYRCLAPIVQFARTYVQVARNHEKSNSYAVRKLYEPAFVGAFPKMIADRLGVSLRNFGISARPT